MTSRRPAAAVGLGVVLVVLVAGCTSGGGTDSPTSATPPSTSSAPTGSTDSAGPNPPTATEAPPTSASPSSAPTTAPPTTATSGPPALAACANLAVAVTRVPGGGGVTYGLVSVTNKGTTSCSLPGVPSLRLLDANRAPMTQTAAPDGATSTGLALAPGATASTLLEDRSATCQANTRSSFVEVQATTAAAKVVAALALPPCSLSVKPFVPGTSPAP